MANKRKLNSYSKFGSESKIARITVKPKYLEIMERSEDPNFGPRVLEKSLEMLKKVP